MFARIAILLLTCCSLAAIPRGSTRDELQRLARTPRIEFAAPLEFNRIAGFRVFPDRSAMAEAAAEIVKDSKSGDADAAALLEAARLHDQSRGRISALTLYFDAAKLFQQRAETFPSDPAPLLGLAECFDAVGRFGESQSTLSRAASLDTDNAATHAAIARHYQERAWDTFASTLALNARLSFLQVARTVLLQGLPPERLRQSQEFLDLAASHFDKALALDPSDARLHRQRSTFRTVQSVIQAVLHALQSSDPVQFDKAIFSPSALDDLKQSAALQPDPETIAAIALIEVNYAQATISSVQPWLAKLQTLADSDNHQSAAAAADMFGCLQFFLLEDSNGAARSFRRSLALDPDQHRPWDMLLLSYGAARDFARLIQLGEERVALASSARNHILLAKAHERAGDLQRAQLAALEACTFAPNDFLANLSLAALLLKDRNFEAYSWRIKECLNRAQKNIGSEPALLQKTDLAFLQTLFHAIQGDLEKARATLADLPPASRHTPEVQELNRILSF